MYAIPIQSLNKHAGEISEKLAEIYLLNQGFEVCSFSHAVSLIDASGISAYIEECCKSNKIDMMALDPSRDKLMMYITSKSRPKTYESYLFDTFKSIHNIIKFHMFCKSWSESPDVPSGKISKRAEEKGLYERAINFGSDFIATLNNRLYMVEVKNNNSQLSNYQKKMYLKAKELGLTPLLVRTRVTINAHLELVSEEYI